MESNFHHLLLLDLLRNSWLQIYAFSSSAASFVILSLLVALVIVLIYPSLHKGHARFPPGPPRLPVLGNLHFLLGALPHQSLFHLSRQYGPLMCLRLGRVPTLVASSSAVAKEFFKNYDQAFASRPESAAAEHLGYNGTSIRMPSYGSRFRLVKKICLIQVFAAKRLEVFLNTRREEVFAMVQSVWHTSQKDKEIDLSLMLFSLANNTITRMVLGKRYINKAPENSAEALKFKHLMDELFVLHGVFNIGDFIPILKPFDLQGYEARTRKLMKRIDGFLEDIIQEHHDRRQEIHKTKDDKDFLDELLSMSKNDAQFSRVKVKAVLLDLLFAGTDTSAGTSEWALAELLKQPEKLQKLQQELDREVGRERLVEEPDIDRLGYLKAVVKETLRLHPAAPLLAAHESTQACKVNGYDIPAGATLFVNAWAIGRDPNAWSRAGEFYPERFLEGKEGSTEGAGGQPLLELIQFGSGRRMCPGLPLAITMVQFALASLLHSFEWSLPRKERVDDMRESFGLTLHRALPLVALAKPRLPPHLYQHLGSTSS